MSSTRNKITKGRSQKKYNKKYNKKTNKKTNKKLLNHANRKEKIYNFAIIHPASININY